MVRFHFDFVGDSPPQARSVGELRVGVVVACVQVLPLAAKWDLPPVPFVIPMKNNKKCLDLENCTMFNFSYPVLIFPE